MAGWNLKSGEITNYNVNEDQIWTLFNYVFSDYSKKTNTYKFGLIKSLLDSAFSGIKLQNGIFFSYEEIFEKFTINYWNLVIKYRLKQMRNNGKSDYSKVELILQQAAEEDCILNSLEFESVNEYTRKNIIKKITTECKKCVIGALYDDFDGVIYSFDLKGTGITLNYNVYNFILKYKSELEKLNYFSWAKFLEQVNNDEVLIKVIDKLELSTPRRNNLSIYREILRKEFEEDTCFYCGKKLYNNIHVDHFIPWSFIKDDKLWNFVLSCPSCNEKKNNKVPSIEYVSKIVLRNKNAKLFKNKLIISEFKNYTDDLINRMWHYAKMGGLKEYKL